jgi:hypothetical protein
MRLTTTRCPWFRTPGRDRLVAEPDRQAPTLAQGCIMLRPFRHPMLLLRDVVAAIGIELERHGTHRELRKEGGPCHVGLYPDLPPAAALPTCNPDQREEPLFERTLALRHPIHAKKWAGSHEAIR